MAFSEAIKLEVKRKAHFTCCWCGDRQRKVEIHHVVPQAAGGEDTAENAAPLCGACHDVEPLKHPPGALTGQIKDPAVQALVRELAVTNPGLCVITTRLAVADVAGRAGAAEEDLERLPPAAGAELLRRLGDRRARLDAPPPGRRPPRALPPPPPGRRPGGRPPRSRGGGAHRP